MRPVSEACDYHGFPLKALRVGSTLRELVYPKHDMPDFVQPLSFGNFD